MVNKNEHDDEELHEKPNEIGIFNIQSHLLIKDVTDKSNEIVIVNQRG